MERDILVDVRHPFIVHLEYGKHTHRSHVIAFDL